MLKKFLIWLVLNVPLGRLAPHVLALALGSAAVKVESPKTSYNSGSPKCYCCGSGNVVIECGDCKEKRVFGTWSEQ